MINSNYVAQVSPGLRVLSNDQKVQIHQATTELLRRTGVWVLAPEVRELLGRAGCWLNGERVRIPPHLIEWAIRTAPKRVVLCNRDGNVAMFLEGYRSYYGTGSDTPFVIDAYSGERRQAVLADVANVARLVDALPYISFLMCMGIASDVAGPISDLYHFQAMVSNTAKPIVYTSWSQQNLKDIVEMAEAVAGGAEVLQRSPFCALYSEPMAPLTHGKESCEKLLYICSKGLPVVYTPGLITGASSPVTRAGAVVQANAELLSGLLICQLIREGAPVVAGGGGMMTMDMSTMSASYGAPEFMLDWCALSEMGHYYDLPVFGFAGVSDAKTFDQQAAAEGALWVLLSAQSGGNLIHDMGYIESGLTTSYEMLVSMNEFVGLVKRFMEGVDISEETVALDVIDRVGPGGHFLSETHTLRHFRENWYPKLLDRENRENWEAGGRLTLGNRARIRIREILESHQSPPLDEAVLAKLGFIIQRAEERVQQATG
ncbi:MAG: trimethylamine methyltransferase family protein [Chloroflexi bacterium]|nr:trimethylamine methyltransferase family protein [Chloroflexota bacterium]